MSNRAWVTLATNDSYGLGALVLAHSLRRVGSTYPAVILITPSVTDAMRDRLRAIFAEVITVDVLDSQDATHLALLQRPELGITFTKIHCWNLTQYDRCVFLDADILVVQNCDELFEREELSAAPDVGWPDCFNSGVFVFQPSADTFSRLITFAQERGSFDGGDQGLLNSFFSSWSTDNNKRLPFLYNVTSAAFYSYLPALKQYGQNLKIIHFIGPAKPWLQNYNFESQSVDAPEHLKGFLQLWWDLFTSQVHTQLDVSMTGVAGNLARVQPGTPLQREAIDELARRQGWESGNIDYMGADSFANIWAKISQTLNEGPSSPPKQPSPPKESPPVSEEPAKEVAEELAEKVAEATLSDIPDIPVPAREAINAAELALESPVAAPQEDIVPTVISDVHESKPSQEASESSKVECAVVAPESKPAPESESIPTVVHESKPAQEPSDASKVACAAETTEAKPTPESESIPSVVHEPKPVQEPSDSSKVECLKKAPESKPASETESIPSVVHESIPTPEADVPKIEAINPIASIPTETPSLEVQEPSVPDADIKKPVAPPSETPKPESISAPSEPKQDKTPVKTDAPASDSPPLANTPSQEEIPSVTAAKLEERRKPAGKLQLSPPSVADPLPTPDSELEDAASLAQSIIASELRTPTVTSPSPPAGLASPQLQAQPERLDVRKPDVPTPPVGAVSLSQIGVKPKAKPTTASQIESSVSEKPETEAPKKKVVKKVVKKDAASSGEAPVPPPRKKEKKPKDK